MPIIKNTMNAVPVTLNQYILLQWKQVFQLGKTKAVAMIHNDELSHINETYTGQNQANLA